MTSLNFQISQEPSSDTAKSLHIISIIPRFPGFHKGMRHGKISSHNYRNSGIPGGATPRDSYDIGTIIKVGKMTKVGEGGYDKYGCGGSY